MHLFYFSINRAYTLYIFICVYDGIHNFLNVRKHGSRYMYIYFNIFLNVDQ